MTGNWIALTNQPTFNASTMLLLNDGRVMCQESGGVRWWSLSPDIHGSYINGAWQQLAPMAHTRLYYGSAVFADGRVIVTGGEYSDAGKETNSCELYDPVLDQWTTISPPAGWAEVGDGSSVLLPDGRYLTGNASDAQTAIYDPVATWSAGPTMAGRSTEETWVLMPDETILAPRCISHPAAEKLVLAANQWMSAGTLPVDLVEAASAEIGPGMTLPDGRAFFLGATGASALYTPPAIASQPGTWSAGPTLPPDANGLQLGAKDAPGCLLPNGNVLLAVGPVDGVKEDYLSPTTFYEFDGSGFIKVPDPANVGGPPFTGRMMLLPTGEVLFASVSAAMYAYRPSGAPQSVWQPSITAAPSFARRGSTYTLHGRQLNGLSQAVAYGDDAASATNYPLVRIRHLGSGRVTLPHIRSLDHGDRHRCRRALDELHRAVYGADRLLRVERRGQRDRLGRNQHVRRPTAHLLADRRGSYRLPLRQPGRWSAMGARTERPGPGRSAVARGEGSRGGQSRHHPRDRATPEARSECGRRAG
jgi:hypothetical protein